MANTTLKDVILQGDGSAFIRENIARKEAILSPLPLYLGDSDQTDVFDYGGVIKIITLNGIYIGTTEAAVKSFVDSVEALIQGHQDTGAGAPYKFVDDRRTTSAGIKVKLMDVESYFVEGFPTGATWTIRLIEASTNA